jgi:hypothetical protein
MQRTFPPNFQCREHWWKYLFLFPKHISLDWRIPFSEDAAYLEWSLRASQMPQLFIVKDMMHRAKKLKRSSRKRVHACREQMPNGQNMSFYLRALFQRWELKKINNDASTNSTYCRGDITGVGLIYYIPRLFEKTIPQGCPTRGDFGLWFCHLEMWVIWLTFDIKDVNPWFPHL